MQCMQCVLMSQPSSGCNKHRRVLPALLQGTRHAEFVAVDVILGLAGGDVEAARFDE